MIVHVHFRVREDACTVFYSAFGKLDRIGSGRGNKAEANSLASSWKRTDSPIDHWKSNRNLRRLSFFWMDF